jgi:glyoxylase-like metal-dependent hydrolase (beta-lactamase superfamily II)
VRVHHLNCGTMNPLGGRRVSGEGGLFRSAQLVCHCLLVELEDTLVLVDTGFGTAGVDRPRESLGGRFVRMGRPGLVHSETAVHQVRQLGYTPEDVRHIVLTHLDLDHAGGLLDFPWAQVHLHEAEHRAATSPSTRVERDRYRQNQWAHGPDWSTYGAEGEPWFGFDAVRELRGLPADVLLVPLHGHSRGHTGVALRTGGAPGWLLHAGDAYFFRAEADPVRPRCTPALRALQSAVQTDRTARLANQERLRELKRAHGHDVTVFSAHDPVELRTMQAIDPGERRTASGS